MTDRSPIPADEMLDLLEPTVALGLERHLSAATEWFPHDYVPYEVGRNYKLEPWEEVDSPLSPVARTALEINLLTEDNLPYYHLALWDTRMLRMLCYPSATQNPRRDPIPDREEVGDAMVRSVKRREGQPVTPAQMRQRLADVAASLKGAMPTGRLESDPEAAARRLVQRIDQLPDEHAVLVELAELVQTETDWQTLSAQIQQPEFPLTGVNETDFRPFFDEVLRLARAL